MGKGCAGIEKRESLLSCGVTVSRSGIKMTDWVLMSGSRMQDSSLSTDLTSNDRLLPIHEQISSPIASAKCSDCSQSWCSHSVTYVAGNWPEHKQETKTAPAVDSRAR